MPNRVRFIDNVAVSAYGNTGTGGGTSVSSSYAETASFADYATSASYAISASHEIITEVSSSHADTASYVAAGNIDQPFVNITASGNISASNNLFTKQLYVEGNLAVDYDLTHNCISLGNASNCLNLLGTSITASGDVSSSAASTASFGTYLGDGSQLTGIDHDSGSWDGQFTGSAGISGSLSLEGSGSTIFDVQGSAGQLFSVSDGLLGTLMEVNDISGMPLFQVSSSGLVEINVGDISGSSTSTASFGTYLGDGSQLTGITAATNLTQSIFVTQNGNDSTATIGDLHLPFATLASASQAATTGSVIFVYPGTYTAPTENLAFEGGSYYFYPNTVVSKSAAGPVFNSKNYSIGFNVYGHADFYLTSSCEEVIEAGNSSAPTPSYTFECQDITQLCGGDYAIVTTVDNSNSTTDIAVANIKFRKLKTDGSGISIPGPYTTEKGNYLINCNEIYADVGGIYSYQGYSYLELNATRIVANGGAGIRSYYGYNTNINVGYLYGTTYGYDSQGSGYININSSYVSGINNVASVITMNGHCAVLDTSGGKFIGNSIEGTGTWSGGINNVKLTPTYTEFLVITGGNHRIDAGGPSYGNSYFPSISIQGGLTYIDGYQSSGNSNYNYNISGGELIWKGHMKFSTNDNGQNFPFNLNGGVLRIKGHVENSLMDSEPTPQQYCCVYYDGGTLILDGATLITSASLAPPVRVIDQDREVKIYSGGVNTNKTGSMGLLAASSSFGSGGYALTNPLGGMIIEDSSIE